MSTELAEDKNKGILLMAKRPEDYELNFLHQCTKDELEPLVGIILGTDDNGNIDRSGRISSSLESSDNFKKHYPDHTKYVDEIIEEIQTYGGNTFVNLFRGCGVTYHEILCDACDKLDVNYNKVQSTELIEEGLLCKVLRDMWAKLSDEEKKKLLAEVGGGHADIGGMADVALIALVRAGGFASFRIMLIVVNAIAKVILGRGLPLAANAALAKMLGVLAGPIGWAIAGVWTAFDIAAPAYRVTLPAVVYISALRKMKKEGANLSAEEKKEAGFPQEDVD